MRQEHEYKNDARGVVEARGGRSILYPPQQIVSDLSYFTLFLDCLMKIQEP
jgi:hypothetical protein